MTSFACVLARSGDRWTADEVSVTDCESITDLADIARDVPGTLRLLLIEQDDEYAAIIRIDDDEDEPRAFLSDGHAADFYPIAADLGTSAGELLSMCEHEGILPIDVLAAVCEKAGCGSAFDDLRA